MLVHLKTKPISHGQHIPQGMQAQEQQKIIGEQNVISDQLVKQDQSLELVQTLLSVSFALVCYLRGLLPVNCFEDRDMEAVEKNTHWRYRDFIEGKLPRDASSRDQASVGGDWKSKTTKKPRTIVVITRGTSTTGDKLMYWLDGIFDALAKSYLAAVQLSVILEKNKPENVIETYTFAFRYTTNPLTSELQLGDLELSSSNGKAATIRSARSGIRMLSRHLVGLVQGLPDLPESRFVTVHLLYGNDCPDDYEPPGFCSSRSRSMFVPENECWKMDSANLGEMDSGFHRVGLKVGFVATTSDLEACNEADFAIPHGISCTKSVPRFVTRSGSKPAHAKRRSVCEDDDEGLNEEILRHKRIAQSQSSLTRSQEEIMTSQEAEMREQLKRLAAEKPQLENLVPTQKLDPPLRHYDGPLGWILNEAKAVELRDHFQELEIVNTREVSCECGISEEEGAKIQCKYCGKWQHKHCYSLERGVLGPAHVCYRCLAENKESALLDELRGLAKLRRALYLFRLQGIPTSNVQIAKALGYPPKTTSSLLARLKTIGLLVDTQSWKRGLPKYALVDEAASKEGILNPLYRIEQYYVRQRKCMQAFHDSESPSSGYADDDELVELGPSLESILGKRPTHEQSDPAHKRTRIGGVKSPLDAKDTAEY
ncbi:DNA binding protein [Schaereria dolodes]|nr:DNA binding protein [Schaereria dolodes]